MCLFIPHFTENSLLCVCDGSLYIINNKEDYWVRILISKFFKVHMFLASLRGCFGDILGNVLCLVPPLNENIEEYNLQCISKQKTLRDFSH